MKRSYLILLLVILIFAHIAFFFGTRGYYTRKQLSETCQPSSISYKSWDPYCVIFYEKQGIFNKVYEIGVYKEKAKGDYGHSIIYDTLDLKDVRQTQINWTEEGIELTFDSGHKLTIPKKSFIGGR